MNQDTLKAVHLGYIERYWEILASIAWKNYTSHGRGALLFTQNETGDDWDCIYLPLEEFKGVDLMRDYCDLINEYDPMSQLVAVFLTPPDCVSTYCGGLTPERIAPPAAFKRFGYSLNSN